MVVLEAGRGVWDHQSSCYDALTWATARLNQIRVIFGGDFNDGRISEGVRFVNPFSPDLAIETWIL
jgi:predicted nucleic acid-binding protein